MKKKILKSTKKDEVLIVLEKMNENIGIIAEGQQLLRGEMNRRFDESDKKLEDFKNEMSGFRKEMYIFRDNTEANLKVALEYLSRIDDEITEIKAEIKEMKKKDKVNEGWMASIEKRIGFIEKQLKLQKQMTR